MAGTMCGVSLKEERSCHRCNMKTAKLQNTNTIENEYVASISDFLLINRCPFLTTLMLYVKVIGSALRRTQLISFFVASQPTFTTVPLILHDKRNRSVTDRFLKISPK